MMFFGGFFMLIIFAVVIAIVVFAGIAIYKVLQKQNVASAAREVVYLPSRPKCSACGKEVTDDYNLCPYCGNKLK